VPEVRPLSSTGITRLHRSNGPVRLPIEPPPIVAFGVANPARPRSTGPPPVTRIALPTCRAHYPGGSVQVHVSGFLPRSVLPSPLHRRVGIRIATFEACSGFTRVTARWLAQPPKGGLCHKAPARSVARASRLSATRSNRLLSRWNPPPLATRASGAHCAMTPSREDNLFSHGIIRSLGHSGQPVVRLHKSWFRRRALKSLPQLHIPAPAA
jgi:hypothetical protein